MINKQESQREPDQIYISTAARSRIESCWQVGVGKGGMANPGGLLAGGSILMLSTRAVVQGPLDRDLAEGLLVALWLRGRWVLEGCTPSPWGRWKLGSSCGTRSQEGFWCLGPHAFAFSPSNSETFCYFPPLPSTMSSWQHSRTIFRFFLLFIIKKFKHWKNGKNCIVNISLPSRSWTFFYICFITYLIINLIFDTFFRVANISTFHL